MTVRDRLGVIEARAQKATQGPWDVGPPGVVYSTGTDAMVQTAATGIGPSQDRNGEFIAAARSDVPALVRALQAVLDVCDGLEAEYARRGIETEDDLYEDVYRSMQDAGEMIARFRVREELLRRIEAALSEEP